MYIRLAFAVAAHLETEILIVDEVLAVGDSQFQKKCLGKIGEVSSEGRTVLFVTHNMLTVGRMCSHAILLADGKIDRVGPAPEVVRGYLREVAEASAHREWPIETAPRSDIVRLRSIRVRDIDGNTLEVTDIREAVF